MSNTIKYSESIENSSVSKGNWYVGTGDVDKGPTDTTGFYSTVSPPLSGYTLYVVRPDNLPSVFVAQNDQELLYLVGQLDGDNDTIESALEWIIGQDNIMLVDQDFKPFTTRGLMVYLDPRQSMSYPKSGSTWYDLSNNEGNNNFTLYGAPTFEGNSIRFDGTDDYGITQKTPIVSELSFEIWFKRKGDGGSPYNRLWQRNGGYSGFPTIGIETGQYVNEYGTGGGIIRGAYSQFLGDYFSAGLSNFVNDEWWWFGGTIDSNNIIRGYSLGGKTSETQLSGPIMQTEESISMCIGDNRRFNGEIGLFRFYNETLTDYELKVNYLTERDNFILGDENVVDKEQIFYIDAKYIQSYGVLEPTRNFVYDLSGDFQWAKAYNGVERIENGDSSYFTFDGTDDSIRTNDLFKYPPTGPFSMEIWVKYISVGALIFGGLIVTGNPLCDGCEGGFGLFFNGTNNINLRFDKTGSGNLNGLFYTHSTSLIDDDFHHIVAQRTNDNLEIYLDGSLVATTISTNVEIDSQQLLQIGSYNTYSCATNIAMVKIYKDYLTSEEVLQNYNAQKGRFGL